MIFAIVPAAGLSSRMGRSKLALRFGSRTVLEHVVTELRDGGAAQVVVVVASHFPELRGLAESAGASVCAIAQTTPDMRATVEEGFNWLEMHYQPQVTDAFLLAPGDHPLFDARVVRHLCVAYQSDSSRSIIIPTHLGRRGHPSLISWRHVAGIRTLPSDCGIDSYLRARDPEILDIAVPDAGVLFNLDAPEDYDVLRNVKSLPRSNSSGSLSSAQSARDDQTNDRRDVCGP
jgi:CTP:molybdopterin cytidylyltransferase MocA